MYVLAARIRILDPRIIRCYAPNADEACTACHSVEQNNDELSTRFFFGAAVVSFKFPPDRTPSARSKHNVRISYPERHFHDFLVRPSPRP